MSEPSAKIVEILGVLAAAYPNFNLQTQTIQVYRQMLADLDPDLLEQAAKAHLATHPFFPTVAELRENAGKLVERATATPSSAGAWGEVLDKIHRYGNTLYGGTVPEFSSPLIARVVGYFGWNELCLSENLTADRARFLQAYEIELARAREDLRFLPETHCAIDQLKAGYVSEGIRQLTQRLSLPGKLLARS